MRKATLPSLTKIFLAGTILFCGSCKDKEEIYDPGYVAQLKSQLPDFDMRSVITVNIDYGTISGNASVSFYTDNPLVAVDKDGTLVEELVGEPFYSTFLDANGRFSGDVKLPSCEKHIYVYSSDWTAPQLMEGDVVGGKLSLFANVGANSRAGGTPNRVVADANLVERQLSTTHGGITSIVGGWTQYGVASDPNELYGTGIYNTNLVSAIQGMLRDSKGEKKNNSSLVTRTDVVNTAIATHYQNEDGTISTVTEAEIFYTFITEGGYYASSIGYYYYKNGEEPANPDDVEKFIIVPNASVAGAISYQEGGSTKTVVAGHEGIATNRKIQLLFRDPVTNKLTSKFPGGYTIGYFIIPDGYREARTTSTWTSKVIRVQNTGSNALTDNSTTTGTKCKKCNGRGYTTNWFVVRETCATCNGTGYTNPKTTYSYSYMNEKNESNTVTTFYDKNGNVVSDANLDRKNMSQYYYDRVVWKTETTNVNGITYSKEWIYSNNKWNAKSKDRFIALTDPNTGEVVYGIEDSSDESYEDILFTISCSPNTAIYNPERPTISEDGTRIKTLKSEERGYYLFEDIWSSGGDYDMNDVIVEYKYTENIKNVVTFTTTTNTGNNTVTTKENSNDTYLENVVVSIIPKHCGATYKDGFSLQLPETFSVLREYIESIKVNGGDNILDGDYWKYLNASNTDMSGNVINVSSYMPRFTYEFFDDIKIQQENKAYSMVIKFKDKAVTQEFWEENKHKDAPVNEKRFRWSYNPFLKVYDLSLNDFSTDTGNRILEIHMPLYPYTAEGIPTAGGASSGTGSYDWNLWFVAAINAGVDGSLQGASDFYPFAMDIPYYDGFYPSREMVRISESYPEYKNWTLGGNSDWYKHRAKNKTQPFTLRRENWIFFDYDTQNEYDK